MPTQVTRNTFALTPESRSVLTGELDLFENLFQPRQTQAIQTLLSLLQQHAPTRARAASPGFSGAAATLDLPVGAVGQAAQQRGLQSTPQAQDLMSLLRQRRVPLLDLLRQQARQQVLRTNSLVDPRYAGFLRPESVQLSDTEQGGLEQASQILNTILALGGTAASIL